MKKGLGFVKIYGILLGGTLIAALGISLFFTPINLVAGGLSGISIMIHRLIKLPVGLSMLVLNIPLFILGFKFLGGRFLSRSLFGALFFSLWVDITAYLPPLTKEPLLCSVFGGALLGIGIGIIFLFGATTGGTDIIAKLLCKVFPSLDVGRAVLFIDGAIIITSGFVFGNWEACLYGVIAAFLCGYCIDACMQGVNFAKVVYIISPENREIASSIITHLKRGVTGLYARGMYAKTDNIVLICVIKKYEIPRLKELVYEKDDHAFIIFTGAHEVHGEGFKIYPI